LFWELDQLREPHLDLAVDSVELERWSGRYVVLGVVEVIVESFGIEPGELD
jgi:hypothetical protein